VSFGARALVRLGAISHNLDVVRSHAPGAKVMAVVKANAYGHGLVETAGALAAADCLAVARLGEARLLRESGCTAPVALLGGVLAEDDLDEALDLGLQLGIHNARQVDWLQRRAAGRATVWLKVDTGMNRLGFRPDEAPRMIERLRECAGVAELRLMTHFANAEYPDDPTTLSQIRQFGEVIGEFDGDISVANSPGVFGFKLPLAEFAGRREAGRWWIRPGIALYGVSPFPGQCGEDLGLRPAMDFRSRLAAVKRLCEGEPVGYGGAWRAGSDTVLGIVAAGYGDGYSRSVPAGTPVLVNGRRVAVAGRVSMDLTAVDLGPGATDQVGDPVVLWGSGLPVEEIAMHAGTIPYTLLCGVSHREPAEFTD